ncbi:hypothetical protein DUNSADRAFT_2346 [Dunaliella salina]|uniref:Uncharacterized protein n=1 Tax=Dunaliella salina TaxID=3046 RepID=A0ABQ7GVS5_DUNSA|nr:hypothetical protein DUNSADRAFT_2346 [Dunaliella salina]|eukprot:KAF5838721.1 hypothetical protein DUNSADRAFT_2346 [Dunaliella salina]
MLCFKTTFLKDGVKSERRAHPRPCIHNNIRVWNAFESSELLHFVDRDVVASVNKERKGKQGLFKPNILLFPPLAMQSSFASCVFSQPLPPSPVVCPPLVPHSRKLAHSGHAHLQPPSIATTCGSSLPVSAASHWCQGRKGQGHQSRACTQASPSSIAGNGASRSMAADGSQGPVTPLPDEAVGAGSGASSRKEEGFFQTLASDDERIAGQQRALEDIPPPPPLPEPEPEPPSSSRHSIKPRAIPADVAQAALERSKPRSHSRGRARRGTGQLQKWPEGDWGSRNGVYGGRGLDDGGIGEGEEPSDPAELRAKYAALKREYEALRGMVKGGGGEERRQRERMALGSSQGLLDPSRDAGRGFATRMGHKEDGRFSATGGDLSRRPHSQSDAGLGGASVPNPSQQPLSQGERILQRRAISRPRSECIRSDEAFVQELQQKVHGMPPVVQPQLQEAVEQLQAYCSAQQARDAASRSGAGKRVARASEQGGSGRLMLHDKEEEGEGAGGDEEVHSGAEEEGGKGQLQEPLVYNSEVEVVSDAMEIVLGTRLPEKAFYGSRARTLMQLSINEVKTQCTKWKDVCGLMYARHFLVKEPRLLAKDPALLLRAMEMFSTTLYLSPPECVSFAMRNSFLVAQNITKEHIQGAVSELAKTIDQPEIIAAKLLTRCTLLLSLPHGSITARFEALAALLPVTRQRLASACKRRPLLLLGSVQRLASHMVYLASLLDIPLSSTAMIIATTPGVLGIRPSRLVEKWRMLCRVASMHVPWAIQVADWREPTVGRILTVRKEALDRARYILRHGMQVLPQAQNFKRLLTMSNRYFYRHFVAPFPARTIYGKIRRFPERPPKQASGDKGGSSSSSSSSSIAAGDAGSSQHKAGKMASYPHEGSQLRGSSSSGRNGSSAGERAGKAEATNGREGTAASVGTGQGAGGSDHRKQPAGSQQL